MDAANANGDMPNSHDAEKLSEPAMIEPAAVSILLAGTISDLFGRRYVLLMADVFNVVGNILCATSHGSKQFIAGMTILGASCGMWQLGLICVPELLPNNWRHIGVVLADTILFVCVVVGPVVGRYAVADPTGRQWEWNYWAGLICMVPTVILTFLMYKPPKHPHGASWKEALLGFDYGGAILVTSGLVLTLVGIVYSTTLASTSGLVVGPLVAGLVLLAFFGVWENISKATYKLCPPHIFTHHRGRAFTAPFIFGTVITMFYYGMNVLWPTMIAVLYTTAETPISQAVVLGLPTNIALVLGAVLFATIGHHIKHWKVMLIISFVGSTLFGGLMALVTVDNKKTMIAITFLEQFFFGWAQYACFAWVQLGVDQLDLGAAGGLGGVGRFGGASLAIAIYSSILKNTQRKAAKTLVVEAGLNSGLTKSSAELLLQALSAGSATALQDIPGITASAIAQGTLALKESYVHGIRITALSSLAFGCLGTIMCFFSEDIEPKMNEKTNVFLENDIHADMNKFH
ncbi:hypothetical protein SEUCBS139899_004208 [Sporothrix eucalyptigena]